VRKSAIAAVAVGALALTGTTVSTASAAPVPVLKVIYDATGSSTVLKTGSVVALGPTTLITNVLPDGTFTGSLILPPAQTSFKLLGFLPVTATVNFIPVGPVKGALGIGKVRSKAFFDIRLSDVTLAGIPTPVGDSCQTGRTVIPANTPKGEKFDLTKGGNLTGTYTIGQFSNCGLTTVLINQLIPGPGNTATLTLSNGHVA
jgi:hypothetical protein